jgi:hypothetical protein
MKKLFILLSLVFYSMFTLSANAQCPTPKDCPNDPFIGPLYTNIPLTEFPGCTLRVEYWL